MERLVIALETGLLDPLVRASPAQLDNLLAPDFTEIGRTGKLYSREQTIAGLLEETGKDIPPVRAENFVTRWLSGNVILLTYDTRHPSAHDPRPTRRSSIWKQKNQNWQLLFHQGTPI